MHTRRLYLKKIADSYNFAKLVRDDGMVGKSCKAETRPFDMNLNWMSPGRCCCVAVALVDEICR